MASLLTAFDHGSGAWFLPILAFYRDLPEGGDAVVAIADEEEAALAALAEAVERVKEIRSRAAGLVQDWTRAEVMCSACSHPAWTWLKVPAEHAERAHAEALARERDDLHQHDRRKRGRRGP